MDARHAANSHLYLSLYNNLLACRKRSWSRSDRWWMDLS